MAALGWPAMCAAARGGCNVTGAAVALAVRVGQAACLPARLHCQAPVESSDLIAVPPCFPDLVCAASAQCGRTGGGAEGVEARQASLLGAAGGLGSWTCGLAWQLAAAVPGGAAAGHAPPESSFASLALLPAHAMLLVLLPLVQLCCLQRLPARPEPHRAPVPSSVSPCSEFGLSHDSYKEFHPLMIYYSKQVGRGSCGC